jgi:hypothetical protein
MIFEDPQALKKRIEEVTERPARAAVPQVFADTSAFMSIDVGSVLRVAGNDYLVLGHAREGRFGIDEQPKFWVKSSVDLTTGMRKIIKLEFHEEFTSRIGTSVFRCLRNPEKESAVLNAMRGHPHFMQGESVRDAAGNLVRIIDFIPGPSLYEHLRTLDMPHEVYYRKMLSDLIQPVIVCIEAIAQLHRQGLHHGDIRGDHILLKNRTGAFMWIDFDYEVNYPNYDLFGLGNILHQVAGKGRHSIHDIRLRASDYPYLHETLTSTDMSLMFPHRVANLRKLFPYIPADLNNMLMRFSVGHTDPYRDMDTLLSDLHAIFPPAHTDVTHLSA